MSKIVEVMTIETKIAFRAQKMKYFMFKMLRKNLGDTAICA